MNKLLLVPILILFLAFSAFSEITPIKDIQFTEDPSGDSPLLGQEVTISGIVIVEHRGDVYANGSISSSYFFLMDANEAWSGIQIYYKDSTAAEGDSLSLTGTVGEYKGQTQLGDITAFIRHSTRNALPGPLDVTTIDVDTSEAYEGCLVRVNDVTISETDIGNYKNWKIDDGSGEVKIDTRAKYYFNPVLGESLKSLTGVVLSYYDEHTIAPRLAWDIVEGGKYTRIQRIQQVRNSDLLLALNDSRSDVSYSANQEDPYDLPGDTLTIKGVVTMPTGLSFARAGIKFILSEPEGGPWSSVLSYHPDSSAYPVLLEGDLIEMTGYIGEYNTGPSNMTEFWITSPIEIIELGHSVPAPDYVETGDLRIPETAEQWGNVMVYAKEATIVNYGTAYELFGLDDGSGYVLVDDDSDSLGRYYDPQRDNHPIPPLGTIADSIRGWVYHHYGSYGDSTAYKLEPLYIGDILWGVGPPAISNVSRDVDVPTSTDIVTISADITTNQTISETAIYYDVILNDVSAGYTKINMVNLTGNTYEGQIPAQIDGSFINYYITTTDDLGQTTFIPADTSLQNYTYIVIDGALSIHNLQYTPWEIADSPFENAKVEVTGITTVDTAAVHHFESLSIQDAEAAWSGIFIFDENENLNFNGLNRGDEVTVFGTVTDYNPDWDFKWNNNTVILADSIRVNSSENTVNPIDVSTGELAANPEAYEGVLVKISDATFMSVNSYDVTFDDGSGACLIDDDFISANSLNFNGDDDYIYAFGDTLHLGEKVDMIQGVFVFSFGSFKIEVRDAEDFGTTVGVDPNYKPIPLSYKLEQNFPNPFNPETRIYFEIADAQKVTLVVYNMLGQKVRTITNEYFNVGHHIVNWDGHNDAGNMMPTGVYIYRIKAGNFIRSKKMIMMK